MVNKKSPLAGIEPAAFELEVQRAIHCATGAYCFKLNFFYYGFLVAFIFEYWPL
jgi:hypothetical protein